MSFQLFQELYFPAVVGCLIFIIIIIIIVVAAAAAAAVP
jgi:hypothetical protein